MEHISENAWADLVRGVSTPESESAIEAHLASGCSACRSAADFWKDFTKVAQKEKDYEAPQEVVQLLHRQFAAARSGPGLRRLVPTLIFDTFAQALPVGIRSGSAMARQLVYETEGLTIDLRIDKQPNSKALSIVGQVLDARTLRLAPESVPVALLDQHGTPLQCTSTSNFGEFHLEVASEMEMQLAIEVDSGRKVCITLPTRSCEHGSDFGEQNRLPERAPEDYSGK